MLNEQGAAVYLARPCQYLGVNLTNCDQRYWTNARFAEEVIASTNQAVSALKQHYGARQLLLVGYSGGAAVATLVASRRVDVLQLVTIAGNLDHHAWTRHHRIDPLRDSLNASDAALKLQSVPQVHLVGEDDRVIPPQLAQRWPVAFVGSDQSRLKVVPGYDHDCCWVENWPILQRLYHVDAIAP